MTSPVLTVAEAAALLQCGEATVREQARELCGVKFGRDWVFPAEAFFEALNKRARDEAEKHRDPRPVSAVIREVARTAKRMPPKLPSTA